MEEPILQKDNKRYVIYPIIYQDIWDFYKMQESAFWRVDEVDLSDDISDWNNLDKNTKFFIKNTLSFFAASDSIVNENLAQNFINEVKYSEAQFFYGFQIMMENIHSNMYAELINTYIKDLKERDDCFNAIENMPIVAKKANWALNWIESDSFAERLIAFAAVEGIFFAASFASIFYIKSMGKMKGLCQANALIQRDEALHCDFAIHLLNNHIVNKPSEQRIKEILLSALDIEKEFASESLPVSLIGMNSNLMRQYLEYVVDQLLIQMKCTPVFNVNQPFSFMSQIALKSKQNFFEGRPTEYKKPDLTGDLVFEEEF
jgi:ribonucleoside-diphosphate reductase beta chain